MPIYENRLNAENKIRIDDALLVDVVVETGAVFDRIVKVIAEAQQVRAGKGAVIALDGWYGVDWGVIVAGLKERAPVVEFIDLNAVAFKDAAVIETYKRAFLTDDPGFGRVNSTGTILDVMDADKLTALRSRLAQARERAQGPAVVVYGSGAAVEELRDCYDKLLYCDKTADPMLWKMWDGELVPFGYMAPKKGYGWKEYYYCDFYLLNRHKNRLLDKMDWYVEAIEPEHLKLVSRAAYDAMIKSAVQYPIKQIKTYSPGPWGAYRYKDFWDIPGLECNAWNRLAGADLSILLEVAPGKVINMPTTNLMCYAEQFVGPLIAKQYPGLIPLEVWLDDGYFPEPQPAERTSMPIHNHPDTSYVKRHFNEPLGRYETYYIIEAYEGANTWMGFKEGVDLEEWEELCRESERTGKPIPDWKDYIANWETNVGDLFLIPPGTTHCHGGNQMVLEMDTCPSVCGAEYSFFAYDFCRPTWDDKTKTMTGKPMNMHMEHAFDNERYCRENWVKENLCARPAIVKWTKEYWIDRYDSHGPMPFEIERIHFDKRAEYSTEGKFFHAVTLAIGQRVAIRSKADRSRVCEIDHFQAALIPAGFGDYEVVNLHEGHCQLVLWRWKTG